MCPQRSAHSSPLRAPVANANHTSGPNRGPATPRPRSARPPRGSAAAAPGAAPAAQRRHRSDCGQSTPPHRPPKRRTQQIVDLPYRPRTQWPTDMPGRLPRLPLRTARTLALPLTMFAASRRSPWRHVAPPTAALAPTTACRHARRRVTWRRCSTAACPIRCRDHPGGSTVSAETAVGRFRLRTVRRVADWRASRIRLVSDPMITSSRDSHGRCPYVSLRLRSDQVSRTAVGQVRAVSPVPVDDLVVEGRITDGALTGLLPTPQIAPSDNNPHGHSRICSGARARSRHDRRPGQSMDALHLLHEPKAVDALVDLAHCATPSGRPQPG
jgi:hypothetical protein